MTMSGAHTLARDGRIIADIPQGDCEAEPQTPLSGFRLYWTLRSGRMTSVRLHASEYDDLCEKKILIPRC